jgi:hypothetical protein
MTDACGVRPELITLDPAARGRVRDQVAAKGGYCECCGGMEFGIGDALFLGFLFLDEDHDAYMVALTCRNPQCAKPRTGIILGRNEFFDDGAAGRRGNASPQRAGRR